MTNLSVVTQALVDILKDNADSLGLLEVEYGDVDRINKTPCACVVPQDQEHKPTASFMLAQDDTEIFIFVHHGKLQTVRKNLKECLQFCEAIETKILEDKTLGGLLVFSWVSSVAPGAARVGDDLMATSRIVWNGRTRTQF